MRLSFLTTRAFNNHLALMDCRHRDTGEAIAVLCAAHRLPPGEIGFVPLDVKFHVEQPDSIRAHGCLVPKTRRDYFATNAG